MYIHQRTKNMYNDAQPFYCDAQKARLLILIQEARDLERNHAPDAAIRYHHWLVWQAFWRLFYMRRGWSYSAADWLIPIYEEEQ